MNISLTFSVKQQQTGEHYNSAFFHKMSKEKVW